MTTTELPPPTSSVTQALTDLSRFGLAILRDALPVEQLATLRERLHCQAQAERAAGVAFCEQGDVSDGSQRRNDDAPNQRVLSLLNKGEVFYPLVEHELILKLIKSAFAATYGYPDDVIRTFDFDELLLSSISANIAGPGGSAMNLHADQGFVPPQTNYPLIYNVIWPLSDFTAHNGATRVVPGSHTLDPGLLYEQTPATVPVVAPAGSAIIVDGRLWHGTGANETAEQRYAILANYCRPFVRPFTDFGRSVSAQQLPGMSEQLRSLLGLRVWSVFGSANGEPHGTLVDVDADIGARPVGFMA